MEENKVAAMFYKVKRTFEKLLVLSNIAYIVLVNVLAKENVGFISWIRNEKVAK